MKDSGKETKTLEQRVSRLNQMIQEGQVLPAFEKFYAEDVVMQENENEPTKGKVACRINEETFVNGITAFRKAEIQSIVIGDNISVTQWSFDFTHKDWGVRDYNQISVQRWNDEGQIINEKFYYSK